MRGEKLSNPERESSSESMLWTSVILQAFNDATRLPTTHREAQKARQWFEERSIGFDHVCNLAGKNPDWVQKHALKAISTKLENKRADALVPIPEAVSYSKGTKVEFGGKCLTIGQWAIHLGISNATLYSRINTLKWPIEKVLATPRRIKSRSKIPTASNEAGVGSDFPDSAGTGGGSIAHDFAEIEFFQQEIAP